MSLSKMAKQNCTPAAYYRGGTSRALIFQAKDLPKNRGVWPQVFLGVIGSPDPNGRQLDGLGEGISSLSKICVVSPSMRPGIQVDFTFVQVGVKNTDVDYSGSCGNMTSAIGPFAIDSGLIRVAECATMATVRIYNTNTDKIIDSTFPVSEGEAVAQGQFAIDGVSGTGSRIQLDFLSPAGSKTGKLLPTGNIVDTFDGIKTCCIDVGNPSVFAAAEDLGIHGAMLPDETQKHTNLLERLEAIRQQAANAMGIAKSRATVPASIPKICFVSLPSTHALLSGELLDRSSVDVVVRAISVGQPHRALPITTGLSVSVAARIPGSIVHACIPGRSAKKEELTIGHPSGRLVVGAKFNNRGDVEKATVFRTARRLMEGKVFWK